MHAGPILCLDDVRYCCRSAAREPGLFDRGNQRRASAARGGRRAIVLHADERLGLRLSCRSVARRVGGGGGRV